MKLVVATRSAHKMAEIRAILGEVPGLEALSLGDVGVDPDPAEEGLEPFHTFEANAVSKARWFHERTGLPTTADDSGLAVDALGGGPGVRSKRFAPVDLEGESRDRANNAFLLETLADVPDDRRTARYVCAVALVTGPADEPLVVRGEAEGRILREPRGGGGFGYDPLFLDPELGRTFAEISAARKHERSHRGKAFRELARRLRDRS